METEKRARIHDIAETKKKLKKIGAAFVAKKEQKDDYFGSIELYKKLGYSFLARIRKSNNAFFFAVKTAKPKKDGVWEEFETTIEHPETLASMLEAMGLDKIISVEKQRETFKLGSITINLDCFKDHGTFIELESISETPKTKQILAMMDKIGIKKEEIINIGYISIFLKETNSPFSAYVKN